MFWAVLALPAALLAVIYVIYAILLIAFVDHDSGAGATWLTIGMLIVLRLAGVLNLLWPLHNTGLALIYFAMYLALGVPWAFAKWYFHLESWKRRAKDQIMRIKKEFLSKEGLSGTLIPEALNEDWKEFSRQAGLERYTLKEAPDVRTDRGRLMVWAAYWPVSAIWTLINDPLKNYWTYLIVHVFGGQLERMAKKRTLEIEQELAG